MLQKNKHQHSNGNINSTTIIPFSIKIIRIKFLWNNIGRNRGRVLAIYATANLYSRNPA